MITKYTIDETINILKKRPSDHIYMFNNVISGEHCEIIREHIEKNAIIKECEKHNSSNVKAYVRKNEFLDSSESLYKEIFESFFDRMCSTLQSRYGIIINTFEPLILRKIYGDTSLHIDDIYGIIDLKTYIPPRKLACIIAVNDDYEGGELIFPCQDRAIKLKKGQMILFPPYFTHPHYSEKLKNNTYRYTITTWLGEHNKGAALYLPRMM
jgi:predicted 2-oxoglutarate/Fe(II)-dependent dioxygenase YbiX